MYLYTLFKVPHNECASIPEFMPVNFTFIKFYFKDKLRIQPFDFMTQIFVT